MRMNQLVAPTSFMTSISRRRANIAMRIVLRMSSRAAPSSTAATKKMAIDTMRDRSWTCWTVSKAKITR